MCLHTGWQRDCEEISPYNKAHCHKNTVLGNGGSVLVQCDSQRRCVGFNHTSKVIYSYTARIKGIDVMLPPEDAGPSSDKVGDSVWVKIPQGRCTTQFGNGTITGVYSPHLVLVDGIPHHVKDVRPLRGVDTTNCSITSTEDKAPMLYLTREDSAASESDHSDRGQHGPRDMSEDEDIAESVPLRRSSRLKRPAPCCTLWFPNHGGVWM